MIRRYLFAATVSGIAISLTTAAPSLHARPYLASAGAVVVAAWYGGYGPALLSTALSVVVINIYLASMQQPWGATELVQGAVFIGVGLVVTLFTRVHARSRDEVRRQSSHLEAIFRQASTGIAIASLDGRLTRVNQRMSEIIGRSPDEAVTLSCEAITHPDDWPQNRRLLNEIATGTRREFAIDKRYVRPDGSAVWVHVAAAPLVDANGRPEGLIAIVEDVSTRRSAEARLRASEGRYRSLVDASTAIVWTANAHGEFEPPQESWQQSTGQTPAEYAGWGWSAALHPDDRAYVEQLWRDAIATACPVDVETRLWSDATSDYRWYSARAVPRTGASGRVEEWVGACADIHERRSAEIRLQESEERARLALEIAELGTWTWIPIDRHLLTDPRCREICGLPDRQDLQLRDVFDGIHSDDRARVQQTFTDALEHQRPFVEEIRYVRPDQSERWLMLRADVVSRPGDAFSSSDIVLGSVMDVTERRQSEEALRRADREKDDFLALLAHELRNPLAPIRTAVQLLKVRRSTEDEGQRLHAVIDRQVQHLVRMVDDLLDVSRVLRGKVELRPAPLDIAEAVAVAVETSRPLLDAERQQLAVTLPVRPLTVHGDQVRLAQVIANLLNNASKYTETGGTIHLNVSDADGLVQLEVVDTGAGIAPEMLPRIFEPFVQADRSLERARGGLGIGLTLVKKIVELHQGTVVAHSLGLGTGSQFIVRLPAIAHDAAARPDATADAPARVAGPMRILVVDDNIDAAESLSLLLRADGHTTMMAHDGMEAIRKTDALGPDLVILDIGLPGLSGYEVAALLRQRGDTCPHLIAVTGYGQPSDARRAFDSGFEHHLIKPVDAQDLRAAIVRCAPAPRAGRSIPAS